LDLQDTYKALLDSTNSIDQSFLILGETARIPREKNFFRKATYIISGEKGPLKSSEISLKVTSQVISPNINCKN
jgi:hypothetical protein